MSRYSVLGVLRSLLRGRGPDRRPILFEYCPTVRSSWLLIHPACLIEISAVSIFSITFSP